MLSRFFTVFYFQEKLDVLNNNEYFKIFIENLQRKCKQAIKLFKENSLHKIIKGMNNITREF